MAVMYDPPTGVLSIVGTPGPDVVVVTTETDLTGNGHWMVHDNGTVHQFPNATQPVDSIQIDTLDDNDFVRVQNFVDGQDFVIWHRSVDVQTGAGNDHVVLGYTPPTDDTTIGEFRTTIETGDGDDSIVAVWEGPLFDAVVSSIISTGAGNDDIRIERNVAVGDVNQDGFYFTFGIDAGQGNDRLQMTTSFTGNLASGFLLHINDQIRLGSGNDLAVIDLAFSSFADGLSNTMMVVDGGEGDDRIRVHAALVPMQGLLQLDVRGSAGNDRLWLRTSGDSGSDLEKLLSINGGNGFDRSWSTPDVAVTQVEQQHRRNRHVHSGW